jgi:hypothetical protein
MPAALEPNQRFPIVLDIDKDKPVDSRPTFYVVSLSMREQQRLGDELNAALELNTTQEIFDATCQLLNKYLVGWRNMGQYQYPSDVQEFLSHSEARELLRKVLHSSYVSDDEKKS